MQLRSIAIGSLAIVALGAATFTALISRRAPATVPRENTEEASQVLASRLEEVEANLRGVRYELKAEVERSSARQAPAAVEQRVNADAPAPSVEPEGTPEERDRQRMEATLTSLDATIASEARDVSWERESQQALEQTLAKPEFADSRIGSVSCAQSVCKLTVLHRDRAGRQKFVDADGMLEEPFRSSAGLSHYAEATHETIFYLARKGQHLPPIER